MDDGTVHALVSPRPKFFRDGQGNWRNIDTRLSPSTLRDFSYEATQNRVQVYLAADTAAYQRVAHGDRWIDFRPLGLKGQAGLNETTTGINFTNVGAGVDLHYSVRQEGGIKEDIVLRSPQAQRSFQFQLRLNNLELYRTPEGKITFTPTNGVSSPVFVIPEPYAEDADGRRTTEIQADVEGSGDTWTLTYTLPSTWLSTAKYPVTLDPSIGPIGDDAKDTWQENGVDTDHGEDTTLAMGTNTGYFSNASAFLQFPLNSIPAGSTISAAKIILSASSGLSKNGTGKVTMNGYVCDAPWKEDILTGAAGKKPTSSTFLGGVNVPVTGFPLYNPTALLAQVQNWFNGSKGNFGVELRVDPNTGWLRVCASEYYDPDYVPILDVTYQTSTFTKTNTYAGAPRAWEAGEAVSPWQVTNLKNGNVLTAIPLFSWNSRGFPVGVTLYHNSMETQSNVAGPGWSHTYDQTLIKDPSNANNFIYKAGDGSRIKFNYVNSTTWDAEAGIPMRLTYSTLNSYGPVYTLTGPDFSTETFGQISLNSGVWYLSQIRDHLGKNGIDITRPSSTLILVTDTTGRNVYLAVSGTQLLAVTDGSRTWTLVYSPNGKLSKVVNPADRTGKQYKFVFDYNANNAITRLGDPNNNPYNSATDYSPVYLYRLEYGNRLQLLNVEDRNAYGKWFYASGNTTTVTDAEGTTQKSVFDASGNLSQSIDAESNVTTFGWDTEHRLIGIRMPGDLDEYVGLPFYSINYTYATYTNPLNRLNVKTAKNQLLGYNNQFIIGTFTTTYTYDTTGHNRVIKVVDPMNRTVLFQYDHSATSGWKLLTQVTNPDGTYKNFQYDNGATNGNGLLTGVQNENGYWTNYLYADSYNNLTEIRDPRYNPTTYNKSWKFISNAYGDLLQRTDPRGWVTTYGYNSDGRLDTETVKNASNVVTKQLSFRWTPNEELTAANSTGSIEFQYADGGLQTRDTNFLYTYTGMGQRQYRLSAGGAPAQFYTYDKRGNLQSTDDGGSTPLATYTYEGHGWPKTAQLSNGTVATTHYDNLGRVTDVTHTKSDGVTVLGKYVYQYNAANQIIQVNETFAGNTTITVYGYDANGRLQSESASGVSALYRYYKYNPVGNLQYKVYDGFEDTYSYDGYGQNRLTTLATYSGCSADGSTCSGGQIGSRTYTYDENGNRLGSGFAYDEENRATQTVTGLVGWDALDRRVGVNGASYQYDLGTRAYGTTTSGGEETLLSGLGPLAYQTTPAGGATQTSWMHPDALGNVGLMTNASQQPVFHTWQMDAYGWLWTSSGAQSRYDYRAAYGYERLNPSLGGSQYLLVGVRVYDAETGSFLQQDPLSPGLGDYTYVNGDPLNMVDPSGGEGEPALDSINANKRLAIQSFEDIGDAQPSNLRGMRNPFTRAKAETGKLRHRLFEMENKALGRKTEHYINRHMRVDAIDLKHRIIHELKPNNPRAIQKGIEQLEKYASYLEGKTGEAWHWVLHLYH